MNIKELIKDENHIGSTLEISGWITTHRKQKKLLFISINDGSSIKSLIIHIVNTHHIYIANFYIKVIFYQSHIILNQIIKILFN